MSKTACNPEAVKGTLRELHGIEPLKQLFWADLSYKRINLPLSRRGWSETATTALVEDPLILAAGGHDDSFKVVYARLKSEKLSSGHERPVVSQLLQKLFPYTLFVFSNETQDRWHFINIKPDDHSAQKQIFRRITIGPEERLGDRLRTAAERIAMLDLGEDADWIRSLRHPLSVNDIQIRHDQAFNVESLNQQFFKTFAELYHKVVDDISRLRGFERVAKSFAHVLLNRILFLYFIQKKGWLDNKQDYLYSRFKPHQDNPNGHSYYSDVLCALFAALSNPDMKNKGLGAVPFLNGGLFEDKNVPSHPKRFEHSHPQIKNATFKAIFDGLLEKYNFTVMEDTPFSVEVAVNPDMLGRIFESLILELEKDPDKDLRRLTGSYYTPRPIVHFMCQEALKEYLVTKIVGNNGSTAELARAKVDSLMALPTAEELDREQIEALIKQFTPSEAKLLREAILDCRVCDPAVGSGAFPVGMLHEMVAVIARLDLRINGSVNLERRNYYYDLKKQIVQTCLYGVDIQEQAVRLCELRLWLSLVVDYQIDPNKPFAQAVNDIPNLPNLSFRIVRGDSLLERLFGHVVQLDEMAKDAETKQLIGSLQQDKREHFLAGRLVEKRRLELKILTKQAELAEILIEQKKSSMITYQTNIFGEEGMTAKEHKAKAKFEAQLAELADLRTKVAKAKSELERLTLQKEPLSDNDLETLCSKYFKNGEAPTFMWLVEFAEIFLEKGGFDIIVGNPPYINARHSLQKLGRIYKDYLKKYYQCIEGAYDIYVLFWEMSIRRISSQGIAALIVPNKIMVADYAQKIRHLLSDQHIKTFADVSELCPFKDVAVYPVVFLISHHHKQADRVTKVWDALKTLGQLDSTPTRVMNQNDLFLTTSNPIWRSKSNIEIIEKSSRTMQLNKIAKIHGGVTGFSAQKLLGAITERHDVKNALPFIVSGNIDPYCIKYGLTRYMKSQFTNPYLKRDFSCISRGKWQLFTTPKIVIAGMTRRIEAAYVENPLAVGVAVYSATEHALDPYFLLGILNSNFISQWYRSSFNGKHLAGGYLSINKGQLEVIPVPNVSENIQDEIANLAKQTTDYTFKNDRASANRAQKELELIVECCFHKRNPERAKIEIQSGQSSFRKSA